MKIASADTVRLIDLLYLGFLTVNKFIVYYSNGDFICSGASVSDIEDALDERFGVGDWDNMPVDFIDVDDGLGIYLM